MKLLKIIKYPAFDNFVHTLTTKDLIVVHGTASCNLYNTITHMKNSKSKIAVHYVISRSGMIWQLFDNRFYAYHAGTKFRDLSKRSIGILLMCWNSLKLDNKGNYRSWCKTIVTDDIILLNDGSYYQQPTKNQYLSLALLLQKLCSLLNISDLIITFDNYTNKLSLKGITFHSVFNTAKNDFPALIQASILANFYRCYLEE